MLWTRGRGHFSDSVSIQRHYNSDSLNCVLDGASHGFGAAVCRMMIPNTSLDFWGLLHQLSLVLALNFGLGVL